jgi:predicted nucleic acid-binding protein
MFLDTSIIVDIFRYETSHRTFEEIYGFIKDEPLFISVFQFAEISDWCLGNKINPTDRIQKLKDIVNVIPLSERICIEGAGIKHEMRRRRVSKFSLSDGIILASARSIGQRLLTSDSDFRKCDDAIVIS